MAVSLETLARPPELGAHCQKLEHLKSRVLGYGLRRAELFNLPPEEAIPAAEFMRAHGIAWGVHAPLVQVPWYPKPPTWSYLCDVDPRNRDLTLRMVGEAAAQAADLGAEYVVAHFPAPVVEAAPTEGRLWEIALESAAALDGLSRRHGIPIYIEGFGPSPLLAPGFLREVFSRFPSLRYCFDFAHLTNAARRDGFDVLQFARDVGSAVGSMHLWNTRGWADYVAFGHIPVHPFQKPHLGWVDLPQLLWILGRPGRPTILESSRDYPAALGRYDFSDGVQWVSELLTISYSLASPSPERR